MNAIISIHAPHARSDVRTPDVDHCVLISIHAPHARSDRTWRTMDMVRFSFQSTLLMRGATWRRSFRRGNTFYFNPRSSCEERPYLAHDGHGSFLISIHAPHARSDLAAQLSTRKYLLFQSTLLMRGATAIIRPRDACNKISIHAPHARSDKVYVYNPKEKQYISIHAPHARSDALYERVLGYLLISIHAPHARSDTTV